MAKDDVSGVEAPVVARTLAACCKTPVFILVGDKPANSDTKPGAYLADASKLHHVLYNNLPHRTYFALLREILMATCASGTSIDDFHGDEADVRNAMLKIVERSMNIVNPEEPPPVGPLTREEIRETLGWDKVPA